MRVLFYLAIFAIFLSAESKTISLRLVDPIVINSSKTARANFDSLGGAASEEFRRAVFVGKTKYEALSNGETRTSVTWTEVRDGAKSAKVSAFTTRFATREKSVAAGTVLKASGNTTALTDAIRNMQEGQEGFAENNNPSGASSGDELSADADISGWVSSSGSNFPSGSSSTTGTTGTTTTGTTTTGTGTTGTTTTGTTTTGTGTTGTTTTGTTTTDSGSSSTADNSNSSGGSSATTKSSTACKPIIDLTTNTYTVTELVDDECKPTATISSIYETAQACPQAVDFDSNTVNIATRKYALPYASEVQVSPCTLINKTATLLETYNGCQWVSDMDREVAVLQKRFYFNFNNEPVYVTSCVNSDKTAPLEQYKGDLGCQPIIDKQAGTYQETASDKGLCKPIGDVMKIYQDENQCDPFVDYDNGSVTIATIPYVNKSTGKVYVGACERTNTVLSLKSTTDGCSPVLDKDTETAIDQVRWYYLQGSTPRYVSGCLNSDVVRPITTYREYDTVCKNLVDINKMLVIPNYRTLTRLGEKVQEVKGCQYDDENLTIQPTYEGCNQRHDFLTNKTYEQEKLYYLKDGDRNYVTGCRDSDINYDHYLTTSTCTPIHTDNKIILNKRVAYRQSDGTVGYATSCKPVTDELAIKQEFCGTYEHDFITNQSYRRVKDYFIEPTTGDRMYLTDCNRDWQNFPHKTESDGWVHDDTNLKSTQKVRTYFVDTVNNATIYPKGLDYESGLQVAYGFKQTDFVVKQNLGTINTITYNGAYYYGSNLLDVSLVGTIKGTNPTTIHGSCPITTVFGSYAYTRTESDCYDCMSHIVWYCKYNQNGTGKISIMEEKPLYIRADGTSFTFVKRTFYQVQP